jgi:hypothetical protein
MITRSNIRFLALGLAVGFFLAILLLAPKEPASTPSTPKMTVVMNAQKLGPLPANQVIIPAAPNKGMFPIKLEIQKPDGDSDIDRAIRKAAKQKYHLIYREVPPID